MDKIELLKILNKLPDNTEILIGDARGDNYGVVHYATKYEAGEFNDYIGCLE